MRKVLDKQEIFGRKAAGAVAAFSLSLALAAAGCSTNRMPGNGEPTPNGPSYTPATSSSGVSGSSGGTYPSDRLIASGPAGMTSPTIDALTTLAERQAYRGRFLGVANPGPNPYAGVQLPPTGQFVSPALIANPEQTVNSSISSEPTPVITSGTDIGGGVVFAGASTAGATAAGANVATAPVAATGVTATGAGLGITTGVSAAQTVSSPTVNAVVVPQSTVAAAPVFSTPATVATPANTANVLTPGMFAAGPGAGSIAAPAAIASGLPLAPGTVLANGNTGTLNPTINSSLTPSPTMASNPPVAMGSVSSQATRSTAASTIAPTTVTGSSAQGVRGSAISPALALSNASTAAAISARQAAAAGPMTSSSTIAATGSGRVRATRSSTSVTAPATVTSSSRGRAVRVTTAPDGTLVLTNAATVSAPTRTRSAQSQ